MATNTRMRLNVGRFRHASPILRLPSRTAPNACLMVNRSFAPPGVNLKMVNRSAPDLFPAMSLVKKSYIRREKWSPCLRYGRKPSAVSY